MLFQCHRRLCLSLDHRLLAGRSSLPPGRIRERNAGPQQRPRRAPPEPHRECGGRGGWDARVPVSAVPPLPPQARSMGVRRSGQRPGSHWCRPGVRDPFKLPLSLPDRPQGIVRHGRAEPRRGHLHQLPR